jgi:dihydrofolate reductase
LPLAATQKEQAVSKKYKLRKNGRYWLWERIKKHEGEDFYMASPKRKRLIRQRRKRRKKNISFKTISAAERERAAADEKAAVSSTWVIGGRAVDKRSLKRIQKVTGVKFKALLKELRQRFPCERIEVLVEGCGRSDFKQELMHPRLGGNLRVTTTDVRQGDGWPDRRVNAIDLTQAFGKNKFHLVVSIGGGVYFSPLVEKAFFQAVSVLKRGGIGVVSTLIPPKRLRELEKRFHIRVVKKIHTVVIFRKKF